MKKWLILFCLSLANLIVFAQSKMDLQLADQYFREAKWDKAIVYYEDFYQKNKQNTHFFNRYLDCLIAKGEFDPAIKLLKKETKQQKHNTALKVKLGRLYLDAGNKKQAHKEWNSVVKNLSANQSQIIATAREFSKIGQNDFALKVYEKGKTLISNFYVFNYEIAEVYGLMGRYEEMIDLYLELIEKNPGYQQSVQNMLARNLDFEEKTPRTEALRIRLLKRIQKNPENKIFHEMLIWMYIQQKDFNGALVQSKAIDRRLNEEGERVFSLAQLAKRNKAYAVAIQAYEYLIKKGKGSLYFHDASYEKLITRQLKIEENFPVDITQVNSLLQDTYSFLETFGKNELTVSAIRLTASLKVEYFSQLEKAIALLKDIVKNPRVNERQLAETKIQLGDYLLMKNEVWDAAIYYMQAEIAFKYDALGDEAKFKAAKINYYTGNFEFAKSQLDVLKGSTSKLIANDAMYLSHLILDNTGLDTNEHAMKLFAASDLRFQQKQFNASLLTLDSINSLYPGHSLEDDILFKRHEIYLSLQQFEEAQNALQAIVDNYGYDILADNALFALASIKETYLNEKEIAMSLYERILNDFPSSYFVTEARKRYRKLRGDDIQ